jgi:hypothetical protein
MSNGVLTVIGSDATADDGIIRAPQVLRYQVFEIDQPSKETSRHLCWCPWWR